MKVFLNASVILAGLASATGGSGVLLALSEKKKIRATVSEIVLEEVKRNVRKKFGDQELLRLAAWLKHGKPQIVTVSNREIGSYKNIVASKDRHVLSAAQKSGVDVLATLDKRHLLKINQRKAALPFNILTPGEIIRSL